jgi:hypothetical protein
MTCFFVQKGLKGEEEAGRKGGRREEEQELVYVPKEAMGARRGATEGREGRREVKRRRKE